MKYAIQGINAGFSYKNTRAVENVSFSVDHGSLLAIAGPNGSGKTTLLKMLAGLVKPESGDIFLFGQNLGSMKKKEIARRSAWVPQSPEPVFGYRVKNLVMMGRSPHQGFLGFESIEDHKIVKEALEQTDTTGLKNRFLTDLSGGELQRVFIARALCQSHEVLLLDEPTSSLDPAHQIQIMSVLKDLARNRNSTVIIVSHDLNLCSMYADKIMLMKNGEIAGFGYPETVLSPVMLEDVYGCRFSVEYHSLSGFAIVVPLPDY